MKSASRKHYECVRRLAAKKGALTKRMLAIFATGRSEMFASELAEIQKLTKEVNDDIRDIKALNGAV
jgi:hypothetical protein